MSFDAVDGFIAPGFEPVAEAFERNFTEHAELGAAFAAYRDGEVVVDIWGGIADRASGRPWQTDTTQVIFSGTKALAAICILLLIERGLLELESPVADYWPEFAAAGKEGILVDQIVTHTAGLSGFRQRLEIADLVDVERVTELLAEQAPVVAPGTVLVYHPLTYGWLCGELVRRISGRTIGQFFADEVAGPLGLDLWIGLPSDQEGRVATFELAADWGSDTHLRAVSGGTDELAALTWGNPPVFDAPTWPWSLRSYHAAEMPAVGGIGTARSIARLYACLARGGELDGVRLLAQETVDLGRTERRRALEPITDREMAFGVGFALPTELVPYGPPVDAFGHRGAGGSMHGAWPSERVGFSYGMNHMVDNAPSDARADALLGALHRAVTA
jgi:CubicO group peptidase (beta-lactamase class C family)